MRLLFVLWAIGSFSSAMLGQDCDFTISVPQDITLCEPGSVVLDGDITGTYFSFEWFSDNGYSETNNLTPNVFVNQTTTFTLRALSVPNNNLIINGDFSQGNTGFTTQYNYFQDIPGYQMELWNEGTYSVHDNPNDLHLNFSACDDQSGDGNMMVLNGGGSFQQIWCQTVNVDPNTNYIFSAWGTSVNPASPAQLQFSINTNLLGSPLTLSSSTCNWEQFFTTWNSGGNTTAEICVVNSNTQQSGNDFAIDNIFFGPLCEEELSFTVTLETFEILDIVPDWIDCNNPTVDITAVAVPDLGFDYEWDTTTGVIGGSLTTPTITALTPGGYTVTITSANGCTQSRTYEVEADLEVPDVFVLGHLELDCTIRSSLLIASTSGTYTDIIWEWPNGLIENSAAIEADIPGLYRVSVVGDNGCVGIEEVEIVRNIPDLQYATLSNDSLTCSNYTALIAISVVNTIDSITWTGPDIIELSENRDSLIVGSEGAYYFTLHLGEDCSLTDSIWVDQILPSFRYELPILDTLNCNRDSTDLYLTNIENISDIVWSNDIIGEINTDSLTVEEAGIYFFTLLDLNGCMKTDSMIVVGDFNQPNFTVTLDSIDCINNYGRFYVMSDENITVSWSGPNLNSNDSDPIVEVPGNYSLMVMGENGCLGSAIYNMPTAQVFPELSSVLTPINCYTPKGKIEVDVNIMATISWTGPQGQRGEGALIDTSIPGDYFIVALSAEGCRDTLQVFLELDTLSPSLGVSLDTELNCSKPTVVPQVLAQDFTHFDWSGPDGFTSNDLEPIISVSGEYTLRLVNEINGCQAIQIFQVSQDITKPHFNVIFDDLTCYKPSTNLEISGDLGVDYWINDFIVDDSSYNISEPGTYRITALAANGCDSVMFVTVEGFFDTHTIELPEILLNCYQPQFWVNDLNYSSQVSYNWKVNGQDIASDSILVNKADEISLRAINAYGCETVMSLSVLEDFELPTVAILGDPIIKCKEDFVGLRGATDNNDNRAYIWRDSLNVISNSYQVQIDSPGFYELIVTNLNNGCENQSSIRVSKESSPEILDYQVIQPLCFGDAGLFEWNRVVGGTSPYELTVAGSIVGLNESIELTSGAHLINIQDANGCEWKGKFEIIQPQDFTIDAGKDIEMYYGESAVLEGFASLSQNDIASIEWTPHTALDCPYCLNPTSTAIEDTQYELYVSNQNGCVKLDRVWLRVKIQKGYIAPNIFNPESNRGNNGFIISSLYESVKTIKSLSIYDRWGNLVFAEQNIAPGDSSLGWDGRQNGRYVASGVFVWVAELEYIDESTEIVSGDVTIVK